MGGPFQLNDHYGRPFTEKDLLDSYSLIYFGFTNCPDICPDELDKMGAVVSAVGRFIYRCSYIVDLIRLSFLERALPKESPLRYVKPVFVSVDPARDSVEQVRRYVGGWYFISTT